MTKKKRPETIDEWAERLFPDKKQQPVCIKDGRRVIPKDRKYKTYR